MKTRYLAAILVLGAIAWMLWPADKSAQDGNPLDAQLIDRAWIDHMPTYPDEKIDVFFLDGDSQIGVFQNMSVYEGDYSLFAWGDWSGDRFELTMLQQRESHRVSYRVSDQNCDGFDYCMVVDGTPRGAKTYYSMEEWGQVADSDAVAPRIRAMYERRTRARE